MLWKNSKYSCCQLWDNSSKSLGGIVCMCVYIYIKGYLFLHSEFSVLTKPKVEMQTIAYVSRMSLNSFLWILSKDWCNRLLFPWNYPDKNIGVGCHFLPQGICLIQGLNPRLMSPTSAGSFFIISTTWEALEQCLTHSKIHQFSSVAQSCVTLCDPMNHSTPGLPVHHQLPEFTQTHVH